MVAIHLTCDGVLGRSHVTDQLPFAPTVAAGETSQVPPSATGREFRATTKISMPAGSVRDDVPVNV